MKREDIKALLPDISKEALDAIMAEHGKDIEAEKSKAAAKETELKNLNTQLAEANKQIEAFKGMDVEGIKKAADEWKTKYETAQAEAAKELSGIKLEHAVEKALAEAKTKNPKLAKAALDMSLVKLDGDTVLGLTEQLTKLKETDAYFFAEEGEQGGQGGVRVNSGGEHKPGSTPDYDKMTDAEYYKTIEQQQQKK